jgi:mannose-6-phosphate isomerase-like protein (cupin superfamily)
MESRVPTITSQNARPREGTGTVFQGSMSWFNLFDSTISPTKGMTVGIAEVPPGGSGTAHWHSQAEVYYILLGHGHMDIDDISYPVQQDDAIYVPGNAKHNIFNKSDAVLKILYIFPTDSLNEIEYQFPTGKTVKLEVSKG